MDYSKELARKVCEQMGIEWDDTATVPTIRGTAIDPSDIGTLFKGTRLTWDSTQIPYFYDYSMVADICEPHFIRRSIVINSTTAETMFDGGGNAPLAA